MPSLFFVEIWSLVVLVSLVLVPLSWIALYVRGATARDLIFWGAISVVIPAFGPIAALIFAFRLPRNKQKREVESPA